MVVDTAKFLNLVYQEKISCSTKSYPDALLFYYLGYLAANTHLGDILEIGVGGSTYALTELSELTQKTFFVVDYSAERSDVYAADQYWANAQLNIILDDSRNLPAHTSVTELAYCHIDGDKDYEVTLSDLNYCLDHLAINGIICQDDYGNHKWPTVTDAVKELERQHKLKFILVGDSSVWVTKPEYYDYWMDLLSNDYEFSLLVALCNVTNSKHLNKFPEYLFLHSAYNKSLMADFTNLEKNYFNNILGLDHNTYLRMPYQKQSKPGDALKNNIANGYRLSTMYNNIRGSSWPDRVPETREDIESLPEWVKDELLNMHNINIFERIVTTSKE